MKPPKAKAPHGMPEFEGMGKVRTGILVVTLTVLALVAVGLMVNAMDAAHGGVVEAPRR